MTDTALPSPGTEAPGAHRNTLAAAVLLAGTALALINATVVNVAIPAISDGIELSPAGVSWVLAGWALTYALTLIPAGNLGDRYGHRTVFVTGVAAFTITSVLCGLAQDELQLIIARLLQGVAGGLFFPAVAATLSILFQGAARARVFGAMGATIGAAAAVGPLLGGALLQLFGDEGWRSVFFVNVPLGLLIVIGALRWLPKHEAASTGRGADLIGLALLTIALSSVLVPLIVGENLGWPAWLWLILLAGLAAIAAFAMWERSAERRERPTIISPSLFAERDFALAAFSGFAQFAGFISLFYVLALLWQSGLGRSALEMGLLTLPEALASLIGATQVARLTARIGSRGAVIVGNLALTLGVAATALVVVILPPDALSIATLSAPLILTGAGSGIAISATLSHALSAVQRSRAGAASGVIAALQRIGNAVGLALAGAILFAVIEGSQGAPDRTYAVAAGITLFVCAAIAAIGLVLALLLQRDSKPIKTSTVISTSTQNGLG